MDMDYINHDLSLEPGSWLTVLKLEVGKATGRPRPMGNTWSATPVAPLHMIVSRSERKQGSMQQSPLFVRPSIHLPQALSGQQSHLYVLPSIHLPQA